MFAGFGRVSASPPPRLMGLLLWVEGCKTQSQASLRAPLKM